MKKVMLIDGSAISKSPKGVGRYTEHLVRQLSDKLPRDWRLVILMHERDVDLFFGDREVRIIYIPERYDLFRGFVLTPLWAVVSQAQVVLVPMDVAASAAGRPLISVIHGISELIRAATEDQRNWRRRVIDAVREWGRRRTLRKASIVVCNSEFVRDEAERRYRIEKNRMRIGYCAVDPRFYERDLRPSLEIWPQIAQWSGYLLAAATGDPYERYDLCPGVLQALKSEFPTAGMVIFGVRREADYARELVEDFSRKGLVEGRDYLLIPFLGSEEFQALRALYRGADFYLELSEHEGFGMQLVEAMATGATCISSGRAALHEVGGGFAVEVERLDGECVAETIAEAYRRKLHQRNNRDQIEYTRKFNWDAVGDTISGEAVRLLGEER